MQILKYLPFLLIASYAHSAAMSIAPNASQPVTGTFWQAIQPISGSISATQSGAWNITNISGTVSLPTGASTSAKQPALGTAGSASADVITMQGISGGTPIATTIGTNTYTDASSTITSGGTAQTALASSGTRKRFIIYNNDTTEVLCYNLTGTATLTTQGSLCLSPSSSSQSGGFVDMEVTNAISVIATTTGHKYTIMYY